jgi:hypothetical protein
MCVWHFLLSDAISIEKFQSFQIASANSINKNVLFSCLCTQDINGINLKAYLHWQSLLAKMFVV